MRVHPDRIHLASRGTEGPGPVVCWMSRDQRARDNWALVFAQEAALARQAPLVAVFCLAPRFGRASARHFLPLLEALAESQTDLARLNIPLAVLPGEPGRTLSEFLQRLKARLLTTDFDPSPLKQAWQRQVADATSLPFYEVDAHNVVPCRRASDKREFAARTLRPKIARLLPEFLEPFPAMVRHPHSLTAPLAAPDWAALRAGLAVDPTPGPVADFRPGPRAGEARLARFVSEGLSGYASRRNDPNADGQSGLSPYLHFGWLSAQRTALEVMEAPGVAAADREAFLEELVVRRELSDNFCLYEPACESFEAGPAWGLATLARHAGDPREFLYPLREFEAAGAHDDLWNAAQRQLAATGRMHGYLRMYWAKKILEWSADPKEAFETALFLNDRYALDGRDPNGIVGVHWSITGLHDRPWRERPVFGQIRYMNARGCARKFDVAAYVRRFGR